jgi:hypothetical protein
LQKVANSSNLDIKVNYVNLTKGELGLSDLDLGDDISITINVKNLTALHSDNLALNLKVPSGFELINPRIYQTEEQSSGSSFNFQDFKDDRVYTFFGLNPGATATYTFRAKAVFSGDFYQPTVTCEDMYQGNIFANTAAGRVNVKK